MKKVFLALVCLLMTSYSAFGQAGVITLAGDQQGIDCNLNDTAAGMCSYYVVHMETAGATACQFSAPAPSCFTGSWLSDTVVFPVSVGDSQNGISIGYGTCTPGPIHVLTISFFCQGMSQICCYYGVKPHPNVTSGHIEVVDCAESIQQAKGGYGIVNSTEQCECGPLTRDSTWGRVKSIFDE